MPPNLRSRVTLRPPTVSFEQSASLPPEKTYARDYSVEALLGEGGMGKVLSARDDNLGRRVAIKELRAEVRKRPDLWARFLREAQIGGQLEHPNIVPIYSFHHSPDGGPAFVMQRIDGESLADYIERAENLSKSSDPSAPSLKERVGMILPVCDAIAYAHGRGVLHRDLKPENIMLGPHNVVLVADWGIARVDSDAEDEADLPEGERLSFRQVLGNLPTEVEPDPSVSRDLALAGTVATDSSIPPAASGSSGGVKTALGAVLGTPQYMSPEQATASQVGPASDQYSIGLMLLELATLRAARSREDGTTAFAQAVLGDHCDHVDRSGESLDPRLSAIIARATKKEAAARYPGVEELARDVRAFIADEELSVMPDSRARKFLRFLQKHPVRSVSLGMLLLLTMAGFALVSSAAAATRAASAHRDAEALSTLSSSVLGEGRALESYLLQMDGALAGLAQVVRIRLASEAPASEPAPLLLRPSNLLVGRPGVVRNPVDGTLRSYREPVFVFAPGAAPEAQVQASRIASAQEDLIDVYLSGTEESAHALPQKEREALMATDQRGIIRLLVALESGLFVQFPARADFNPDYDARSKDWYQQALNAPGSNFSRPKYGPLGRIPRLALTRAVKSDGKPLGVVAAGFWLRSLVDRLGLRAAPHLTEAFLATKDGEILASQALLAKITQGEPESPVALPKVSSARLRQSLLQQKETGHLVDGEKLFVFTKLSVEDWVLVHQYPRDKYLKLLR